MVGEGVSMEISVGVPVGMGVRPEHAEKTSPQAARSIGEIRFARMVSFIVSKTGRIETQGVVQSDQT